MVWEHIANEIQKLERVGAKLSNGTVLKGTLVRLTFENLGGNQCYGLMESFSGSHYCRICTMHHDQCQVSSDETPKLLRTKETYAKHVLKMQKFRSSDKLVEYTEAFGIKHTCELSKMANFHPMINLTVDPMHDLFGGVIPFAMYKIFRFCY